LSEPVPALEEGIRCEKQGFSFGGQHCLSDFGRVVVEISCMFKLRYKLTRMPVQQSGAICTCLEWFLELMSTALEQSGKFHTSYLAEGRATMSQAFRPGARVAPHARAHVIN
jgi:hypothetical protein